MPNRDVQMISRRRSKIGRGFQIGLVLVSILVALVLLRAKRHSLGCRNPLMKRSSALNHVDGSHSFESHAIILQIRIH